MVKPVRTKRIRYRMLNLKPNLGKLKDEHSSMRVATPQLLPDDSICAKCADLDLRGALQEAVRIRERSNDIFGTALWHGLRIANVGREFRKLQSTDCPLCPILFTSRIGSEQGLVDSDNGDEIRLFGFLDNSDSVRSTTSFHNYDSALLAVVPEHFGSKKGGQGDLRILKNHIQNQGAAVLLQDGTHPEIFSAREVPAFFDVDRALRWLEYCRCNHSSPCGDSTNSLVPGLRLIDCWTMTIKEAGKSSPYAALSYVWGDPAIVDSSLRRTGNRLLLPARLSPVISDAISVTRDLGFQYLWVDKFCIDQGDAGAKHKQIEQMNTIYEKAVLTIIAAAGEDETYGLPGVGQRLREPQNIASFSGLRVISTMKHPHSSIRSSRWASRGWTYQEAALSRRRLVFTDQQTYFECDSMNCFESVYSPMDNLHPRVSSESLLDSNNLRAGMFGRDTTRKFGTSQFDRSFFSVFQEYLSAVQDYSARDLSYDADSLNAFRGIIQRYSNLEEPVLSIWGLPYPARGDKYRYFYLGLTWAHTENNWENSRRPKRRQEFPSWTWAGWSGTVRFGKIGSFRKIRSSMRTVQFGDQRDDTMSLYSLSFKTPETMCRVLRILAPTLPLSLFSCQSAGDGKMRWAFAEYEAKFLPSQEYMLQAQFVQEMMDPTRWRCIWLVLKVLDERLLRIE
ncbi:hypothetical protein INS49_010629 [Diaporthe citri]|uniref:uncharacterized protein n=1 Tax=Diaporthe citri TaxID=83186 RepID=UPI001C7EFF69|nr:uncharacterized protein INS49_010629 [Diaporthe citri]KAG6362399.1 hypothetical protein INS49_010629 [Diaporthe citri]